MKSETKAKATQPSCDERNPKGTKGEKRKKEKGKREEERGKKEEGKGKREEEREKKEERGKNQIANKLID